MDKYKKFDISVEKYGFSDCCDVWNYFIFTISNSGDRYYMLFSDNDLTEDEALKQCMIRLKHKSACKAKFTVKNIYQFIKHYREEIDKLNEEFNVEIREF